MLSGASWKVISVNFWLKLQKNMILWIKSTHKLCKTLIPFLQIKIPDNPNFRCENGDWVGDAPECCMRDGCSADMKMDFIFVIDSSSSIKDKNFNVRHFIHFRNSWLNKFLVHPWIHHRTHQKSPDWRKQNSSWNYHLQRRRKHSFIDNITF